MHKLISITIATILTSTLSTAQAQSLGDIFKQIFSQQQKTESQAPVEQTQNATTIIHPTNDLSATEVNTGLKQALTQGTQYAIQSLGKDGGFYNNLDMRILLPDSFALLSKGLNKIGQQQLVDDFVKALNTAAEKAVPEATEVFSNVIEQMTIADGVNILNGADNAATEYFREHGLTELTQRFLPIVQQTTEEVGVTSAYKKLKEQAAGLQITSQLSSLLGSADPTQVNVDEYVTEQALDRLFTLIAEQEKDIRSNANARVTDLLEKVFGN